MTDKEERDVWPLIDPPSRRLQNLLSELEVCNSRELRRCRPRVRRLAHDLPAFDSVWIDALVQGRKLTSYQARILESPHPEQLRVGPCVLLNRIGGAAASETFLARQIDSKEHCVLKILRIEPEALRACLERMDAIVSAGQQFTHASIVVPHAFKTVSDRLSLDSDTQATDRLIIISRYVPETHLAELLVRRGRFPSKIVQEIGRQLLEGLSVLESAGLCHGDLSLSNVRVTKRGIAVMVDAGIRSGISPEFVINVNRPPEKYDGIAPELIGTGRPRSPISDLYALGCLLWQLLCGRTPYPLGDPLAKLAAHQTNRIEDVREWAPDVDAPLAEAIHRLTSPDLGERPQSVQAALEVWGPPSGAGRKRIKRFRATFAASAPRIPAVSSGRSRARQTAVLLAVAALLVAVAATTSRDARHLLLSIASQVTTTNFINGGKTPQTAIDGQQRNSETSAQRSVVSGNPAVRLQPMPAPNAQGIIQLQAGQRYEPAEISAVGPITIRGPSVANEFARADSVEFPEIVVGRRPLKIWAKQLFLQNVHLRRDRHDPSQPGAQRLSALMLVESQDMAIASCRIESGKIENIGRDRLSVPRDPVAVAWKPIDTNDRSGQNITLKDTVFIGNLTAIYFSGVPQSCSASNCLILGHKPFIYLGRMPAVGRIFQLQLSHTTLRETGALVAMDVNDSPSQPGFVSIDANDCVFDVGRDRSALVEWIGRSIPFDWTRAMRMSGSSSIANSQLQVIATTDPTTGARTPLDSSEMEFEGIAAAPFTYFAAIGSRVQDSTIASFQAPSRSPHPPGIVVAPRSVSGRPDATGDEQP